MMEDIDKTEDEEIEKLNKRAEELQGKFLINMIKLQSL